MFDRCVSNKVIAGKDFYKIIRCHSLMREAMVNLMWSAFEDWFEAEIDGQNYVNLCVNIFTNLLSTKRWKR